jgi:hypothetical protein
MRGNGMTTTVGRLRECILLDWKFVVLTLSEKRSTLLDAKVSAHCNRVAVEDGHTECVSIKLRKNATREEGLAA